MRALGAGDAGPGSSPLLHVVSFSCDEPFVAEQATVPWDNAITPLSRGPYRQENTLRSRLVLLTAPIPPSSPVELRGSRTCPVFRRSRPVGGLHVI